VRDGRIEVTGLTKHFGSVHAVEDLSFAVEPGSVTGFLGPNGAGKTTTLRMLLGLVRPTAGRATIGGRSFDQLGNPARVVGAVLEAQSFHPGRKARDHLRCYAAAMATPPRRVDEVIELVGLQPAARRKARTYSLGMKQRLALATALLGDPEVLVLDEPANGLDPEGIAWLRTFLRTFARAGRTVLVSSHILAEIEQTVDRVVIVSHGRCVYDGHLDDLRSNQRKRILVEAADPGALVEALQVAGIGNIDLTTDGRLAVSDIDRRRVGDIALAAGVALYGISEERTDLEQIFFQLTGQFTAGQPYGWAPGYGPHPSPSGGVGPPGYNTPGGYGPAPGSGPVPGYGPPPGYTPMYGYSPQPSYGPAAGYGPPAGFNPRQGHGTLPDYRPPPGSSPAPDYRPPPGSSPAPGYPPPVTQPAPKPPEPPEPPERSPYAPPPDYQPGDQQ
jgi:ABC-2 type transport system ATP-binding protein